MLTIPRWRPIAVVVATVWAVLFSLPNFLPENIRSVWPGFLPNSAVNLGLDLRGGSHLLLEVEADVLIAERLENVIDEMARALNEAEPRIGYTGRGVVAGAARLRVLNPADQARAAELVRGLGRPPPGSQEDNAYEVTEGPEGLIELRITQRAREDILRQAVAQSIEVIRRRVDASGTSEISIVRQGADRVLVQAPGESDPESLKRRIGQTAKMTFHMVDASVGLAEAAEGRVPPGSEVLPQDDPSEPFVVVRRRAILTGENLIEANPAFDPQTNEPIVSFVFDAAGSRIFCKVTNENTGRRFATVLDGRVITAPRINEPICGGRGQISGNFTVESSNELAVLLEAGALPAPLTVIEQRTVGAELGQDAIESGAIAGMIAATGVLVFMVMAYGLFGLIACAALVLNMVMILAAMSMVGATLTLPGIAGLILTLAVAVDANVLIYERMRDEQRDGRGPALAMDAGFNRALITILDANFTTMLVALILFQFGEGPVRGFAWTLSIGTITSVFTAVLVTQILLAGWFRASRPKTLPI